MGKMRTVIFDFDGTLADTWSVIIAILKEHQEEWGLPELTNEVIADFRGKSMIELLKKYNVVLIKLPFVIPKARKELNKRIDSVKLFPGIKDMLGNLRKKDIRLGILTTNSEENVKAFLKKNGIELFDFIESEISIFGKDKALLKVLESRKIPKNEVVYVGDEIRDIEASRDAGLQVISVTWGFNTKEILKKNDPDYLIDEPRQLLNALAI